MHVCRGITFLDMVVIITYKFTDHLSLEFSISREKSVAKKVVPDD